MPLGLRYYGFRAGAWLAERLPPRLTDAGADLGGRCAYRASYRKRDLVRRNLARVVGEGPGLDRTVEEAYRSYARYWLETFRLGRYSREDLLKMVYATNEEIVDRALSSGTGLIVVLPHFGFYDLLGAWAGAKGYPLTTVAEVLRPRVLFQWFADIRERTGMTILPATPGTQALRGLLRALGRGEVAALVADRDLTRRGLDVEYFGERTTAPIGPALIAARTGAPMVAVGFYQVASRKGVERFRCEITPVPYERTGDENVDLESIAQAIATALEQVVRSAPEQYHLFSPNWPSDESGLPPRGRRGRGAAAPAPGPGPDAEAAPGPSVPSDLAAPAGAEPEPPELPGPAGPEPAGPSAGP
ncbi:MAG TPA: phosphatidylinositol mannoside acyltransferase [Actinomycetota bacterium]|nr:phosphatidylinositol mannoside acyltransferase [Actinomycetota bacterium]